jgi:hypothetical protein
VTADGIGPDFHLGPSPNRPDGSGVQRDDKARLLAIFYLKGARDVSSPYGALDVPQEALLDVAVEWFGILSYTGEKRRELALRVATRAAKLLGRPLIVRSPYVITVNTN